MAKDPVQEALDQLKSLAGSTGAGSVSPIGVPAFTAGADGQPVPFTATRPAPVPAAAGATVEVPVRYYEGADWVPANAGPQAIARLQSQMIAAGLIPRTARIANGVWDETTRQAFRSVLTYANATGLDAQTALSALQQNPPDTPTEPRLTPDIATVAATVKSKVRQTLGRDATPDEVQRLSRVLAGFNDEALDLQEQVDDPGFTGGMDVDPGARLDLYLEDQYRPEIDRNTAVVDLSQQRTNLMGSIFSIDQAIAS